MQLQALQRLRHMGCLMALLLLGSVAGAETKKVVLEPDYGRSGFHRFWLGDGHRDLWTTPIEVEVLDLEKEAGGLSVVRQVGGMQTPGLALKGADGRSYTFRWIDKDPSRLLPSQWRGTFLSGYVKDQTAASHPGAWPVLMGFGEALGWFPFTPQRVVYMPDDAALGPHRELFGGSIGSFGEYPMPAHDGVPGFMGATEIISSRQLWDRWREGPENRIDSERFLRERIVNLWVGNWDRHRSQWRWARIPDRKGWVPVPEDPDQAFSDYGGVILSLARTQVPILMRFEDEIGNIEGATTNGADVDRWLLSELDRSAFTRAATEIQQQLTDEVIDAAVRRLPPEWYALDGEQLTTRLQRRRDDIPEAVERYYRHLAAEVNVHATDQDDVAHIRRFDDGTVELTVASADAPAEPYFERRFVPKETREVRVYLHSGHDRVESDGPPRGAIRVRVLGGHGNDVLDDSRSGKTQLIDFQGDNRVVKGKGTGLDERPWQNPAPDPKAPWVEPRDYRSRWAPEALLWWEPDLGLFLGGGTARTAWGFRKHPHASLNRFFLGYSTKRKGFRFDYQGSFRRMNSNVYSAVQARYSAVDRLNFYGIGNESEDTGDAEFHKVEENLYRFAPTLNWSPSKTLELLTGPVLQYTDEASSADSLIGERQPYGTGRFGQLGLIAGLEWDTRGISRGLTAMTPMDLEEQTEPKRYSGVYLRALGSYSPEVWDTEESFGAFEGNLNGYLGLGASQRVVLAARVGGRRVWGRFPWRAAAFIGGSDSNRGFRSQRFAGEGSFYANFEVRLRVAEGNMGIPGRLWLFGLADAGRVWVEGEESDEWHPSFGGGIAFEVVGSPMTFWTGIAKNKDDSKRFYFLSGFGF